MFIGSCRYSGMSSAWRNKALVGSTVGLIVFLLLTSAASRGVGLRQRIHKHHKTDGQRFESNKPLGGDESAVPVPEQADHPTGENERIVQTASFKLSGMNDDSAKKHPGKEKQIVQGACRHLQCRAGRVCAPDAFGVGAHCRCADAGHCDRRGKRVCASDGRFYDNHCEMHRQACIRNEHVQAVRDRHFCQMHDYHGRKHRSKTKIRSYSSKESPASSKDGSNDHWTSGHVNKPVETEELFSDEGRKKKPDLAKRHHFHDDASVMELQKKEEEFDSAEDPVLQEPDSPENYIFSPCNRGEIKKLVEALLKRQCDHMGIKSCNRKVEWRRSAATDIFNEFDFNSDFHLESLELNTAEQIVTDVSHLSQDCRLEDLVTFYDVNRDTFLSLPEIYEAFGVAESTGMYVSRTIVVIGESLELKCGLPSVTAVLWQRNGNTINDVNQNDIKILDDGSLYVAEVSLSHIGNYSCTDQFWQNSIQSHHLVSVHVSPLVRVSPLTQFHTSGSTTTVRCHAEGVPKPQVSWDFNEIPIPEQPEHYLLLDGGHALQIRDSKYLRDTGAFKCRALNSAGTSQDIATVFIENSDVPKYGQVEEPYEVFVVFNKNGYTAIEPRHCHVLHIVARSFNAFKYKPDFESEGSVPSLCGPNVSCSWGSAVNVRGKFIYVTQPDLNRVVVIEIRDRFNPTEIIPTDEAPRQISYVEHLDEIWVLCGKDGKTKTSLIIRQANFDIQHHTIHVQPFGNSYAMLNALFIPPNNGLNHRFNYGYAVNASDNTTYVVDLVAMKITKKVIGLDCNPVSMAFVAIGGMVLVNCEKAELGSDVFILDYLTHDISKASELSGDPYVSPDSRFLVMVDNFRLKVAVFSITNEGRLEYSFEESLDMHISDVAFLASEGSYDFFSSFSNKNSILYLSLELKQSKIIEGVGDDKDYFTTHHALAAGGMFSDYLLTTGASSVVVIDGRQHRRHCQWQDDNSHADVISWAEISRL